MGFRKQLDLGHRRASNEVFGFELGRGVEAGGSQHFGEGVEGGAVEIEHALGLVFHNECSLAQRVLRGDAGWAFVRVAALRLDTAIVYRPQKPTTAL